MIKAVIFDMDGIIIDSEPIYFDLEMKLFRQLCLPISEKDHDAFVGTSTRNMWVYLKDKFDIKPSADELVKIERELYEKRLMSEKIVPIDGVVELIKNLHKGGLKLAIASSSSLYEIETIADLFKIKSYFLQFVSGDEVGKGKPEPDIFLLAAERLSVKPEECIVIEDSRNGVEAAKKAGMKCIGCQNPGSGSQNLRSADLVWDTGTGPLTYSAVEKFLSVSGGQVS